MAKHQLLFLSLSAVVLLDFTSAVSPSRSKYIPKWKKQACEAPASQNAQSHYECDDNGNVQCLPGWTGDLCDVPICRKGCDPLQGYCKRPGECRCKLGFYGELCNKCIALPGCQHGYCNTSFECICHEGWDGLFCSEPICRLDCHSTRGYCEWPGECKCRLGWAGETCKECQVLPGCLHGTCTKPLECKCEKGWTGILCQTPLCAEGCHRERGYCRKPGECRCKVGWWGKNCDQCYRYPGCVNGTCSRPWECNCNVGYGGMLCDQELNFCKGNEKLCENGGTCVSLSEEDGSYRCLCSERFTGRNCEVEKTVLNGMRPPSLKPQTVDPQISEYSNISQSGSSEAVPSTQSVDSETVVSTTPLISETLAGSDSENGDEESLAEPENRNQTTGKPEILSSTTSETRRTPSTKKAPENRSALNTRKIDRRRKMMQTQTTPPFENIFQFEDFKTTLEPIKNLNKFAQNVKSDLKKFIVENLSDEAPLSSDPEQRPNNFLDIESSGEKLPSQAKNIAQKVQKVNNEISPDLAFHITTLSNIETQTSHSKPKKNVIIISEVEEKPHNSKEKEKSLQYDQSTDEIAELKPEYEKAIGGKGEEETLVTYSIATLRKQRVKYPPKNVPNEDEGEELRETTSGSGKRGHSSNKFNFFPGYSKLITTPPSVNGIEGGLEEESDSPNLTTIFFSSNPVEFSGLTPFRGQHQDAIDTKNRGTSPTYSKTDYIVKRSTEETERPVSNYKGTHKIYKRTTSSLRQTSPDYYSDAGAQIFSRGENASSEGISPIPTEDAPMIPRPLEVQRGNDQTKETSNKSIKMVGETDKQGINSATDSIMMIESDDAQVKDSKESNNIITQNNQRANFQITLTNASQVSGINYNDNRQRWNIQNILDSQSFGKKLSEQQIQPIINIYMYNKADACLCKSSTIGDSLGSTSTTKALPTTTINDVLLSRGFVCECSNKTSNQSTKNIQELDGFSRAVNVQNSTSVESNKFDVHATTPNIFPSTITPSPPLYQGDVNGLPSVRGFENVSSVPDTNNYSLNPADIPIPDLKDGTHILPQVKSNDNLKLKSDLSSNADGMNLKDQTVSNDNRRFQVNPYDVPQNLAYYKNLEKVGIKSQQENNPTRNLESEKNQVLYPYQNLRVPNQQIIRNIPSPTDEMGYHVYEINDHPLKHDNIKDMVYYGNFKLQTNTNPNNQFLGIHSKTPINSGSTIQGQDIILNQPFNSEFKKYLYKNNPEQSVNDQFHGLNSNPLISINSNDDLLNSYYNQPLRIESKKTSYNYLKDSKVPEVNSQFHLNPYLQQTQNINSSPQFQKSFSQNHNDQNSKELLTSETSSRFHKDDSINEQITKQIKSENIHFFKDDVPKNVFNGDSLVQFHDRNIDQQLRNEKDDQFQNKSPHNFYEINQQIPMNEGTSYQFYEYNVKEPITAAPIEKLRNDGDTQSMNREQNFQEHNPNFRPEMINNLNNSGNEFNDYQLLTNAQFLNNRFNQPALNNSSSKQSVIPESSNHQQDGNINNRLLDQSQTPYVQNNYDVNLKLTPNYPLNGQFPTNNLNDNNGHSLKQPINIEWARQQQKTDSLNLPNNINRNPIIDWNNQLKGQSVPNYENFALKHFSVDAMNGQRSELPPEHSVAVEKIYDRDFNYNKPRIEPLSQIELKELTNSDLSKHLEIQESLKIPVPTTQQSIVDNPGQHDTNVISNETLVDKLPIGDILDYIQRHNLNSFYGTNFEESAKLESNFPFLNQDVYKEPTHGEMNDPVRKLELAHDFNIIGRPIVQEVINQLPELSKSHLQPLINSPLSNKIEILNNMNQFSEKERQKIDDEIMHQLQKQNLPREYETSIKNSVSNNMSIESESSNGHTPKIENLNSQEQMIFSGEYVGKNKESAGNEKNNEKDIQNLKNVDTKQLTAKDVKYHYADGNLYETLGSLNQIPPKIDLSKSIIQSSPTADAPLSHVSEINKGTETNVITTTAAATTTRFTSTLSPSTQKNYEDHVLIVPSEAMNSYLDQKDSNHFDNPIFNDQSITQTSQVKNQNKEGSLNYPSLQSQIVADGQSLIKIESRIDKSADLNGVNLNIFSTQFNNWTTESAISPVIPSESQTINIDDMILNNQPLSGSGLIIR